MAPVSLRDSNGLAVLLAMLATASCVLRLCAAIPCPASDPKFGEGGVVGVIVGSLPNDNTLYAFGKSGPADAFKCFQACKNWPKYKNGILQPINGDSGPCAYWVWLTKASGCFLLGCNVCKTFQSFVGSDTGSCGETVTDHYCSGAGPGSKLCSGGVKGDPHYTGGDLSHFEFTGEPGNNYCLVSDSGLHVNVYYGGRYDRWDDNPRKALTWIRKVAVLYGNHSVVFSARPGSEWQYGEGYMESIAVDGAPVVLAAAGESAKFFGGEVEIRWVGARVRSGDDDIDVYEIFVGTVLNMILRARPEVAHLRTEEDGIVHFSLDFPVLQLSDDAHGVLGQTYRPDHRHRLSNHTLSYNSLLDVNVVPGDNAEGFLDGGVADYLASDILSPDCAVSRFAASSGSTAAGGSDDSSQGIKMVTSRKLRL